MVAMINDLRDPLDILILQGQVLVDRLRCLPIRGIAPVSESAERVLLALVRIDDQLNKIVTTFSDGELPAGGRKDPERRVP
jgi:hypothetical protein